MKWQTPAELKRQTGGSGRAYNLSIQICIVFSSGTFVDNELTSKEHIISAWLKVKMAALTDLPCSACFFTNCFVNMFVLTFQEMKCRSSHETLGFAFVEQWMVTQTNFLLLFARFARTSQTSLVMRKWCLNPSGKYLSRVSSTYSWMRTKQESKWWLTTTQKKQWKEDLWGLKENCWKLWDKQCCLSVNYSYP